MISFELRRHVSIRPTRSTHPTARPKKERSSC